MWTLLREEDGTTAIEYALIGSIVSIAIIAGVLALSDNLNVMFTQVSGAVDGAI